MYVVITSQSYSNVMARMSCKARSRVSRRPQRYMTSRCAFVPRPLKSVTAIGILGMDWLQLPAVVVALTFRYALPRHAAPHEAVQHTRQNALIRRLSLTCQTWRKVLLLEELQVHCRSRRLHSLWSSCGTWLVDYSSLHRVGLSATDEGNLTTQPLNGVVCLFDPRQGTLRLKVVHKRVWSFKQRSDRKGARAQAATTVAHSMRPVPDGHRPQQIVTHAAKGRSVDPFEHVLDEFPHTSINYCSQMPFLFEALLRLDAVATYVHDATEHQLLVLNLYAGLDVERSSSPFTAFSRLMMILSALHIDAEQTKHILRINGTTLDLSPLNRSHVYTEGINHGAAARNEKEAPRIVSRVMDDSELLNSSPDGEPAWCADFSKFGKCNESVSCRFAHGTQDIQHRLEAEWECAALWPTIEATEWEHVESRLQHIIVSSLSQQNTIVGECLCADICAYTAHRLNA